MLFRKNLKKIYIAVTNRASTIPSNIRRCQSGTWSAGHKKNGEHLQSFNEGMKTKKQKQDKNEKNKGTIRSRCALIFL